MKLFYTNIRNHHLESPKFGFFLDDKYFPINWIYVSLFDVIWSTMLYIGDILLENDSWTKWYQSGPVCKYMVSVWTSVQRYGSSLDQCAKIIDMLSVWISVYAVG